MKEHNQRWKRLKRGRFGRMSVLFCKREFGNKFWQVEYWYLDGMHRSIGFGPMGMALNSQRSFLRGGKP
jgi:hypothetical protein